MKKYNPTVKDFLESNPNVTLLGLWWAMLWRWYGLFFLIYLGFLVIAIFVAGINTVFK